MLWTPGRRTAVVGRSAHVHACPACRDTFTDNCRTPECDVRCNSCISGIPSVFAISRRPVDCCYGTTRLATKDERKTHRLGGTTTWWLCATCHRTFGYNPKDLT